MSAVTPQDRARAQSGLYDGRSRWANMIEINEENKRNGLSFRMTDDAVSHVWSDVEHYVKTGHVSDALVSAINSQSAVESTANQSPADNTAQFGFFKILLLALALTAVIYWFFYR